MDKETVVKDDGVSKEEVVKEDSELAVQLTDIEQGASKEGWVTKDAWEAEGKDPDEWVSAKAWNKRGELIAQIEQEKEKRKATERVFTSLKQHHVHLRDALEKKYADQIKSLQTQKKQVLNDGDPAAAIQIADQIDAVKDQRAQEVGTLNQRLQEVEAVQVEEQPDPVFLDWQKENSWYKPKNPDKVTKLANNLAKAYVLENGPPKSAAEYRTILNQIKGEVKDLVPDAFEDKKPVPSAVNDGVSIKGKASDTARLSPDQEEVYKSFVKSGIQMTKAEYLKEIREYEAKHG